ncbi:flagellar basal body P-ring formation chaperone FlgA [Achromobacter deleyi]|uniref:flagellar basal body P-ring formation chaperone FlgA n=1 Tax=Achromobacter deleyi TaxID=1353891 RepID=UPI001492CDA7|nr:flagellar basal body P-ring formation chaperone FlgA [Achromobacter deleyi]QVQ26140.1 flagellar basal body P-ring formation protein FlgA [Achromobacter deleyi]UIP21699.1 flagellar basal body P-ring formation chaperone FlgA [Achromobacter deleyi]
MRKLILLLLLWSASAGAFTPDAPAIFLRNAVQVQKPVLTLGDIAAIEGAADSVSLLAGLPIGPAPAANAVREIGREELQRWIDTAPGELGAVTWRGNASVRVTRKAAPLDHDAVTEAAKVMAAQALRVRFQRFDVEPAGNPLPELVAAGQYQLRARPVELGMEIPSRLVVWVELWQGKRLYRAVPVALNIRAIAPVLRLNASLPAGASLSPRDVTVEERDVAALAGAYWPAEEPLQAVRTKLAVEAGSVLMRSQLQALPDVERGDQVALRVRSGSVMIETTAQALQDGWSNRSVRVRPALGTDVVQARVVRSGLVEIQE